MLHNDKISFQPSHDPISPTAAARRLRLEYNRLQRQLSALMKASAAGDVAALQAQIERVARDLAQVRADSVHAAETKLRVALDLRVQTHDSASQRLLTSVLADLHYLAMLTPSPEAGQARATSASAWG